MNNALLDQMNCISKPSVLSYDSTQNLVVDSVNEPHQDGAFYHRRGLLSLLKMIKQHGRQLFVMSKMLAAVGEIHRIFQTPVKRSSPEAASQLQAKKRKP